MSLRALLAEAAARLEGAGCASPEADARVLLAHTLGVEPGDLTLLDLRGTTPEPAALAAYDALLARREKREPLQHLTGVAHFRHVTLQVGPGVFVPRPETELLAGWAIDQCHRWLRRDEVLSRNQSPVVVDLCTGSGALAKAIADEVPQARVHAVELDEPAHAWAARRQGDAFTAYAELAGTVDVVVCNPPYIPLDAWESVAVEARDHDPHLALFSGDDGLDAMRLLERHAALLLKPGGVVGAEHADVQGESAPGVFAAAGRWTEVRDHPDLAGRARFLTARLAR